jgi:hypothetical protein
MPKHHQGQDVAAAAAADDDDTWAKEAGAHQPAHCNEYCSIHHQQY